MNDFLSGVGGRKFTVGLVAIVGVTVLAAMGVATAEQAIEAVKWFVGIVVGGVTVENVATNVTSGKKPKPVAPSKK